MAAITATKAMPAGGNARYIIFAWEGMASGDTAVAVELAQLADRSVQVSGAFDGATINIEGSINGVDYATLTDPQGNALSFTSGRIEGVTELVAYIRPAIVGGGASAAVDIHLLMKG